MNLTIDGQCLDFHQVTLEFSASGITNVFADKNNKTLQATLSSKSQRYKHLSDTVSRQYPDQLEDKLGEFLLALKLAGDAFYRRFLNPYGDETYCTFAIADFLKEKGLYAYMVGEQVQYIGRCRDNFGKRVNYGYGHISPKNCYLDGQATNCHLNALINQHQPNVTFYVCLLDDDTTIEEYEKRLIQEYQPDWNIALKRGSKR